jgi:hypothetical protein
VTSEYDVSLTAGVDLPPVNPNPNPVSKDYIVSQSDLTSIADAIREKAETTDKLVFPNGFVEAISGIETGGSVETCSVTLWYPWGWAKAAVASCFINNEVIPVVYDSFTSGELVVIENVICGSIMMFDFESTAKFGWGSDLKNCSVLYERKSAGGALSIDAKAGETVTVAFYSDK